MRMKEKICLTGSLLGANHGCLTTNLNRSVFQYNGNIPVHLQPKSLKFKVMPPAGKVIIAVFWDSQGVLLAHLQRCGENVNSTFRMQFSENVQANRQEVYCFIMTMPDPIEPEQASGEFKNYSANFWNIRLTAQTWPLVTSICLVR
jgi:hypothetical protein